MYIKRHIEELLTGEGYIRGAMAVTGSRQTGKSTVIEQIFSGKTLEKVTLDDIDVRALAKTNPKLFLGKSQTPLFIDEIQYAPELFPYFKIHIDKTKEKGSFYLSGSKRFNTMKNLSESLAGRVGIFELFGLSMREIKSDGFRAPFIPTDEYIEGRNPVKWEYPDVWQAIHRGAFPELHADPGVNWHSFYNSYINTYIERDVKQIENIGDEIKFYQLMQFIAANSGKLFNIDAIAKELGISRPTCEKWLSILRASNLIFLLSPYRSSIASRAVKTPKIYFLDTGLMAFLTKWHTAEQIETGAMANAFFETFVFCEILKSFCNAGLDPKNYLYFYRDKDGYEIDFIISSAGKLYPVEANRNSSLDVCDISTFRFLDNDSVYKRGEGAIVSANDRILPLSEQDNILPIWYI